MLCRDKILMAKPQTPVHKNITAMPLPAPFPTSISKKGTTPVLERIKGSNTESAKYPPKRIPKGIVLYWTAFLTANTLPCIFSGIFFVEYYVLFCHNKRNWQARGKSGK